MFFRNFEDVDIDLNMSHHHLHLPLLVHVWILCLVNAGKQAIYGRPHPLQWLQQVVEQVHLVGESLLAGRLLHLGQHLRHLWLEAG